MTIPAVSRRKDYVGNGALATYPIPFTLLSPSHLLVYVAELPKQAGVHYDVTGTFPGTGNVVFRAGNIPADLAAIALIGSTPQTQEIDLDAGRTFYESDVEAGHDKATILSQELQEKIDRSVRLAISSSLKNIILPTGAGKFLKWNGAGTNLEAVTLSGPTSGNIFEDIVLNGNLVGDGSSRITGILDLAVAGKPWVDITSIRYGAVPNDEAPEVMAANAVAIQAALDDVGEDGIFPGAMVVVPAGVYHTSAPLLAQDHYLHELLIVGLGGRSTIYGHDFDGPVINFGGSIVRGQDMNFYTDNTSHAAVFYRTATYSGALPRFFRCSFAGDATKALITMIACEVATFDTCRIQPRTNDVPGLEWAYTDIWGYSAAGYLPNWEGVGGSNTMLKVINSYLDQDGVGHTKGIIRIHDGNNFIIQNNGFTRGTGGYAIEIGNDYGYSVGFAEISGNRDESVDGGPFLRINQDGTGHLIYKGNMLATPNLGRHGYPVYPPDGTNTYAISVDDDITLSSAILGPNFSSFGLEYRLGIIDKCVVEAPNDIVSVHSTVGLGIQRSTVRANRVYYTGTNPKSNKSNVTIIDRLTGSCKQEYLDLGPRALDPIYAFDDQSYGVIAVPDGSGWNPTGIENTPHYPALVGGAMKWVTPPFIVDIAAVPASAGAAGKAGQMAADANYLYFCIATDTWIRIANTAW